VSVRALASAAAARANVFLLITVPPIAPEALRATTAAVRACASIASRTPASPRAGSTSASSARVNADAQQLRRRRVEALGQRRGIARLPEAPEGAVDLAERAHVASIARAGRVLQLARGSPLWCGSRYDFRPAMEIAALAVAVLALLVALAALAKGAKAGGLAQAVEDAKSDARRRSENTGEALELELKKLRALLCLMRSGAPLTDEMIREGRLWRDVEAPEAVALVKAGGLRILDVRTPQETAMGVIPGALLIPIQELERRAEEIPRDGQRTLVYCAGGGRSSAACEYLSAQGHANLVNLAGGMGAWTGPVERR
jgi:rhodanese-related sulfurtransferase